jgi:hypothetical protein
MTARRWNRAGRHTLAGLALGALTWGTATVPAQAEGPRPAGYARVGGSAEPVIRANYGSYDDCPAEYVTGVPCHGPHNRCRGPFCDYTYGDNDPCTIAGKLNAHDRRAKQSLYRTFLGAVRFAYCAPLKVGSVLIPHSTVHPVHRGYIDPRDTQAYAAEGYGVTMSVPMPPVVRYQYNYGWGVPSSRLTRIDSTYDRMYPDNFYTQAGTPDAAGSHAPQVAVPTDTTQLGFVGKHVPTWRPVPNIRYGTPAAMATRYAGETAHGSAKPIVTRTSPTPVGSMPATKIISPTPAPVPAPKPVPQGVEVPAP